MIFTIKMSILNWIKEREIDGIATLSVKEVRENFPQMPANIVQNELYRLTKQREIALVHKGFYSRIPVQYKRWNQLPPYFYIDQLMAYLQKPYYIGLLTAGELHGASHQSPQRFCVFTTLPAATVSPRINPLLFWCYRRTIPQSLLLRKNSETGDIQYSNAELTAVDLVQYSQYIGGLSRASTVLAELMETADFGLCSDELFSTGTVAAFQRLGYLLEEILDCRSQAQALHQRLKDHGLPFRWVDLSRQTHNHVHVMSENAKWKILVNAKIEVDDL